MHALIGQCGEKFVCRTSREGTPELYLDQFCPCHSRIGNEEIRECSELLRETQCKVTLEIQVLDFVEQHLDAEPCDPVSGAFKQNRENLFRKAAAEKILKGK